MGELIDTLAAFWISACAQGEEARRTVIEGVKSRLDPQAIQLLGMTMDSDASAALDREKIAAIKALVAACSSDYVEDAKPTGPVFDPFNLPDRPAMELVKQCSHLYDIDGYYDICVSREIGDIVADGLEQGLGRKDIGKMLLEYASHRSQIPQRPPIFWQNFAACMVTRSRCFGIITDFNEVGFKEYQWVGAGDGRSCFICSKLYGRIFAISDAIMMIDGLMSCTNPEDAKRFAPWMSVDYFTKMTEAEIDKFVCAIPPACPECRCDVVCSEKEGL
jgi:hypothetical protein